MRHPDGSAGRPLRVMLVPADGGTEEGTLADFEPVFRAITDKYKLNFEIRIGQSYNTVVEAMANELVDIAFFGAVSFQIAKDRGVAELLAVEERKGKSAYFAGVFCRTDSGLENLQQLRGKTVSFGDVNSTSSFNYPVAMLMAAGVDPARDLDELILAGSHANSLQALANGKVDAACASLDSYEKAVTAGSLDPSKLKMLQKSMPIPSPPLAMHVNLPAETKERLRDAFRHIHEQPGVTPESLRGYGGKIVDRYNAEFPEEQFDKAMAPLSAVTKEVKDAMVRKAAER